MYQPLIQQTPIPLTNWTFLSTTLVVIALGHIVNDKVCKQSSGTWDAPPLNDHSERHLDIQLPNGPIVDQGKCQNNPNCDRFDDRTKSIKIINSLLLMIPLSNKPCNAQVIHQAFA